MAGNNAKKERAGTKGLTFTVAECGEFHSLGECHEGSGHWKRRFPSTGISRRGV